MNRTMMERFSEACGASGPLLVDVHNDGAIHRARRIFHQPFLVCGRHPDADLELRNEGVSRRHCYIQTIGGRIFSIDLGTRAGIRVDGTACRTGWLDGSREICLGPVGLGLQGGDRREQAPGLDLERPSPLSARYAQEHPMPEATLEIGNGGVRVRSWPMSRVMILIGRSPGCQLRLHSPLVSNVHCALLRTEAGVWVVDLLSQGGVYVDGMAIRVACLTAGAELCVGPFTIRLREGEGKDKGGDGPAAVEAQGSTGQRGDLGLGEHATEPSGDEPEPPLSDQLRQVLMMARALRAMQRDQQDAMREETRALRGLAEELRNLRSELIGPRHARPGFRPEPASGSNGADPGFAPFEWQESLETLLPGPWGEMVPPIDRLNAFSPAYTRGRDAEPRTRTGPARGSHRDPRALHAIATEFLSAYNLERQSLKEKLIRALLGPDGATDLTPRSRSR